MNTLQTLLALAFMIGIFFAVFMWGMKRADHIVGTWARRNGYKIIKRSPILFNLDPFVVYTHKRQAVYKVELQDKNGTIHHAYLRIGGQMLGLFLNYCEVKWLD